MTSCITFNCISEKGPPFPWKPILLAGTWKQYSKKAIAQLISTIAAIPSVSNHFISLNFRWPYQAKVIKVFERIKSPMVYKLFIGKTILMIIGTGFENRIFVREFIKSTLKIKEILNYPDKLVIMLTN